MGKPLPSHDWCGLSLSQGRYLVRAKLGEGGMGFVYRALDRNLEAEVVVKVPRRAMLDDPEFAGRFAREVRSLVKLAHPRIVKVTDVGEHDGLPYAVMQYLSGGSLEDSKAVAAGPTAALKALPDWLTSVAAALDFVHTKGYVHRDVKPGNILFDAQHHAFLSDFGVAKAIGSAPESRRGRTAATGAGLVLGTPEYMAPELVMGLPFDGRIDQYALAVTVFEILAGRYPFVAPTSTATLVLQTTQAAPELCRIEPSIPRGVSDAIARAMSKDPLRRFPTCGTFATAVLQAALETATTTAGPPRSGQKRNTGNHAVTRPVAAPRPGTVVQSRPPVGSPPIRTVAMVQPAPFESPLYEESALPARRLPKGMIAALTIAGLILGGTIGALEFRARGTTQRGADTPSVPAPAVNPAPIVVAPAAEAPATFGVLEIDATSTPKESSITLDGKLLSREALSEPQELPLGDHVVEVTATGFAPVRHEVVVVADKTTRLILERPPEVHPPPVLQTNRLETSTVPPPPTPHPSRSNALTFEPEPNAPAVEDKPLADILANSATFSNRVVIPTGLYVIGRHAQLLPDGTILGQVAQVKFGTHAAILSQVHQADFAKPIVLETGFARRLIEVHALQTSPGPTIHTGNFSHDFGDTAAVLTLHVAKRSDGSSETWVPIVHEAEFLTGMDFWRIGERKFHNSFASQTLTPDGIVRKGVSPRTDWSSRLDAKYLAEIRHLVHNIKDARFNRDMQQLDSVMGKMLNNLIQADAAAQRAAAQRARSLGR
jgi:serine/threonine protein kinase